MPYSMPIIRQTDRRTGLSYAIQVEEGMEGIALEKLSTQMEHDYQKTLPPDQRLVANQPTDFKCPFCKTTEEPESRKEKISSGWLFGWSDRLVDIFKCKDCGREFTDTQLSFARSVVMDNNFRAVMLEKYKDGEIREELFQSATALK